MIAKPTRVILVCILAIVVGACGSSDDSPEPGASAATTTTQPAPNMSEATDALSLQEAGSEPRQPLVLRVAAGTTRKVAFVSKFGLEMEVEGEALPEVRVPATRMVVEQRVDSVDADGTIRYSLAFTDVSVLSTPGVEQDVVTQTEAALAGIVGITGTGTMDARGGNLSLSFDTDSITDSALKASIESTSSQVGNLSAPFPTQPVGIGARWTAQRSATINGITMNTTTTFTLRGRQGDKYRLDVDQEATAPPGPVDVPGLPMGTEASVEDFTLDSNGHINGDLTQPLPDESANAGTGDAVLNVAEGADRQTINQHMTIEFSLEPA